MAKDRNHQKRIQQKRAKKEAKRKNKAKARAQEKQRSVELPSLLRRQDPVLLWDQDTGLAGLAELLEIDLGTAGRIVDDYVERARLHPSPRLWHPARVAELPIEALVEAVTAHGVNVDEESFRATAALYRGARALVRGAWHHDGAAPTTHDLFDLAAARFWAAWVPERASDEELEALYSAWSIEVEEVGVEAANSEWHALWDRARTTFSEDVHDFAEWSSGWDPKGALPYDIEHVCDHVEPDVAWSRQVLAGVRELTERFPLPADVHELLMIALGHGLNNSGDRAAALDCLATCRADHAASANPYLVALDVLGDGQEPETVAARETLLVQLAEALPLFDDVGRIMADAELAAHAVKVIEA